MDGSRFDALTRSLTTRGSRRRALGGLLLGSLGLVSRGRAEDAGAHDKTLCREIRDKTRRKKCVKKAKKHTANHTTTVPVAP